MKQNVETLLRSLLSILNFQVENIDLNCYWLPCILALNAMKEYAVQMANVHKRSASVMDKRFLNPIPTLLGVVSTVIDILKVSILLHLKL